MTLLHTLDEGMTDKGKEQGRRKKRVERVHRDKPLGESP